MQSRTRTLLLGGLALLLAAPAPTLASNPVGKDGRIAFTRVEAGQTDVWTMGGDGSGQVNLTKTPAPISETVPAFSPEGRRIAFVRGTAVWVMNDDGSGQAQLTTPSAQDFDNQPSFSPDGRTIVFTRCFGQVQCDLLAVNEDGSAEANLTNTTGPVAEFSPDFSPDGRRIAFTRIDENAGSDAGDLLVMNVDGSDQAPFSPNPDDEDESDFSPDGETIAFARFVDGLQNDLFTIGAGGLGESPLTTTPMPQREEEPSFSGSGQSLAFSDEDTGDGRSDIARINSDGSGRLNLTGTSNPVDETSPDWETVQRCAGREATIVGDDGPDETRGTKRRDVIVANAGKDLVSGRGGNDLICLGKGADRGLGGPGKDRVLGGQGKDRCVGGKGRDTSAGCERRKRRGPG
jgi:Tol biopolymer transport system component